MPPPFAFTAPFAIVKPWMVTALAVWTAAEAMLKTRDEPPPLTSRASGPGPWMVSVPVVVGLISSALPPSVMVGSTREASKVIVSSPLPAAHDVFVCVSPSAFSIACRSVSSTRRPDRLTS